MEEELVSPLEAVSKDSGLIKEAQKEVAKLDVHICGGCHSVYHFVEEFTKHKNDEVCKGVSQLKCENEEKPQVWGFTLWKTRHLKKLRENSSPLPSSWEVYQQWISLDKLQKVMWVSAGKTLLNSHKIATAKIQEVPARIFKEDFAKVQPKGVRTTGKESIEEFNVERIVGKRFNPKKRQWEYEVKWENYTDFTWEPLAHLDNCRELLMEYEARLKAEKEKEKASTPTMKRGRPRVNSTTAAEVKVIQNITPTVETLSPGGRPQRTSKQKAVSQVKAWCGDISDSEENSKRSLEGGDSEDDTVGKKMKLESESDDDIMKSPGRMARVIHAYTNGVGKKLPDNVLIPDAKGVVRISQKQLPALSSGVYIMSKSSGIIKLDPAASKIATSGGQAIVKVKPKVGQTQIKIIKKDTAPVKKVVQTIKVPVASPSVKKIAGVQTPKVTVRKELERKATPRPIPGKTIAKDTGVKMVRTEESKDEDSDYGLEELEFPAELPPPQPDSPPGDFTLDPMTGKVSGLDYPSPSPEPVVYEVKKAPPLPPLPVSASDDETPSDTIDNIVKLAAADITEEDLKPDLDPVPTSPSPIKPDTKSILSAALSNSTILHKTLLKPKHQRPELHRQGIQQKTPPMLTSRPIMSPMIKNVYVKPKNPAGNSKMASPRARFHITQQVHHLPKSIVSRTPVKMPSVKPQTSPMSVPRRIGNTTVFRTTVKAPPPKQSPVQKRTPQRAPELANIMKVNSKPKAVISMPSLDEDTVAANSIAAAVAAKAPEPLSPKPEPPAPEEPPAETTDLSALMVSDGDKPMFITGDDGTIYEVVGQNEEGQTILLAKDSEGHQQCLLVTNDTSQDSQDSQEETQVAETPAVMETEEPSADSEEGADDQPLVAQFLRSEPPSPGGTHKVVVMLPGGDVMVTQVTPEEYASLELDK